MFSTFLLQVLDDGILTDNKGRKVNFKNTIIIMTSNIGSDIIQDNFDHMKPNMDERMQEQTKIEVFGLLKKTVRPEFLNRIDETIMFKPLDKEDILSIVKIQFKFFRQNWSKKELISLHLKMLVNYIAEKGYDPQFGARPVKRLIQKEVLNALSKHILRIDHKNREEPDCDGCI